MADRRRDDERKRKEREKQSQRVRQRLDEARKMRDWRNRKYRRRKRDCDLGMPFIVAFQGDPTQLYYCADMPTSYELIPRTNRYPSDVVRPLERLRRYMRHHVTSLNEKVLIYKAGRRDWRSRFDKKSSFAVAWMLLSIVCGLATYMTIESLLKLSGFQLFIAILMWGAIAYTGFVLKALWAFYDED